jgi:DNA invertase Pin-like site-specific DNA recombinase
MKKACAYLRVSTEEQTFENQLPAIQSWANNRGYELTEVYQESESAWRDGHQRELARLLNNLKTGRNQYQFVVVWSLDRLTRQGISSILQVVDTFKRYGTQVISIQESWTEQTGPMAELLYAICGWAGKFESDRRSERTKAGLARLLKTGVTREGRKIEKLGRPKGSRDKKKRRKVGYLLRHSPELREKVNNGY